MRNILSLLLASLLSFSLIAHPNTFNGDYTFTIHLGAFVKAHTSDFEEIRPYGFLYAQRMNNLLQVYMGDYLTEGEAAKVLEKVKRHNYPDAFITRRDLKKGKDARVIQLATEPLGATINWQHYASVGPLYVLLNGNNVKILTGLYTSLEESNSQLRQIKAAGFKDAFAKNVNDVLLHPVLEFEAGEVLNYNNNSTLSSASEPQAAPKEETRQSLFVVPPKATTEAVAPKETDILTAKEAVIPESYDLVEKRLDTKPETTAPKASASAKDKTTSTNAPKAEVNIIAIPSTRANVKRNSAYNLQLIMKQEGVYNNSLDGFYGPGTKQGWDAIQQKNEQLKKYLLLAGLAEETMSEKSTAHILQYYITSLNSTPDKSIMGLKNSEEAVAKAYRAYALFAQKGAGKEVNDLMNSAIKEAFINKKMENKPPFDYTVTYDYKDINQLILHLRYVQHAAKEPIDTPLWLFTEHPKATQAAFEPYAEFIDDSYPIEDALQLFDWSEITLLQTILKDLNTNKNKQADLSDRYLRSRLLLAPKFLSQDAHVAITNWNKRLWEKMDKWGAEDALHEKLLTPFKLAYFQTLVRLEDYYMDKGFDARTATALGLKVMKTFVDKPLANY